MFKPCPFCGNPDVEYFGQAGPSPENYIECDHCGIQLWFDADKNHKEVAAHWNTRVIIPDAQFLRQSANIGDKIQ